MDNFKVKYVGKEYARHLLSVIKAHYEISEEWESKTYVGLTFDWDYKKRRVRVSMPGYVDHGLIQFKHGTPQIAQDQSYQQTVPNYGDRHQFTVAPDGTSLLNKDGKKFLHQVLALYCTMQEQ